MDISVSQQRWSLTEPNSIDSLQVVYKIAERCNINCSYCYYFNMGDESAFSRPARASTEVTDALAHWIAQGCDELKIPHVSISFHGGEPMLLGADAFDDTCDRLRGIIEPTATLSLSMQTNGTLLDDRWVRVVTDHAVAVGVSIDGPEQAHDRFRLDRRGHSTFGKTEDAVRRLVEAHTQTGKPPSTISVLSTENDYREVYRYLRGLGVTTMSFLLPDRNADDVEFARSPAAAEFGRCLSEVFSEWLAEDNPEVQVRFINDLLVHFRRRVMPGEVFTRPRKSTQVVIARSDGTVAVDDTFIPALSWYGRAPVHSTSDGSLRKFLGEPIFREIDETQNSLPSGCADCRWRQVCRGGDFENRFSARNGFDNPSVYCSAYQIFYQHVCDTLIDNGYPRQLMMSKFEPQ